MPSTDQEIASFHPPPFVPHRIIRGGHLQTIIAPRQPQIHLSPQQHQVAVSDGDSIVLHEDQPKNAKPRASMLLIHGISGCHAAAYMIRLADQFLKFGIAVYRMDMRGCGAGATLTQNLTHAGRSDDVMAALQWIAERNQGELHAIGVSLGANQLLRAVGRVGAAMDSKPDWFDRLTKIAAVAPPLDLQACSDNMERLVLRPYNRYFIRSLLGRVPPQVAQRSDFQQNIAGRIPRTLKELDDRITAPLSGFQDAEEYYAESGASLVTFHNQIPTLVLAAADDPIVPVSCFQNLKLWPVQTNLLVSPTGGHVGFIDHRRKSWMDEVMASWFVGER